MTALTDLTAEQLAALVLQDAELDAFPRWEAVTYEFMASAKTGIPAYFCSTIHEFDTQDEAEAFAAQCSSEQTVLVVVRPASLGVYFRGGKINDRVLFRAPSPEKGSSDLEPRQLAGLLEDYARRAAMHESSVTGHLPTLYALTRLTEILAARGFLSESDVRFMAGERNALD